MKRIFYWIPYFILHLTYFIWEFKVMDYPYLQYVHDVDSYNSDINYY
jgi:hypothetical protein